ncbi:FRG domain-containing protein [Enterobacter roggenkampii]|uniref:FRG domain-containing protein n=1 Tax=Enterobacter roggenkampii TaxID=1812935 RepID=UPI0020A68CEB|nr:FRG domain-containing protein [Enterobacter roggenkampii]
MYASEDLAVRDIVSLHPNEFSSDKTMFDRLVRMQHFGLPTRLLDVTSNPLVALWFVTETSHRENERHGSVQAMLIPRGRQRYYDSDRVSCMANLANLKNSQKAALFRNARKITSIEEFNKTPEADMLVFHIGMEKPNFRPLINPFDLLHPVYEKLKMSNKRIVAQSGVFLLYGTDVNRSNGEELTRSARVWIHEDDKPDFRRELEMLGKVRISRSFLPKLTR